MKEIELSKTGKVHQGKYIALVDDEIYDFLNQWNWTVAVRKNSKTQYVYRKDYSKGKRNPQTIYIHQVICDFFEIKIPEGFEIDHIDRNGLNNQKNNFRIANTTEQGANNGIRKNNTSGFIGVSWNKDKNQWSSYIKVNKKKIHLGYHNTVEEAARVRDIKAKELFGNFAILNFSHEENI